MTELAAIRGAGLEVSPDNLKISDSAHLVLPHHIVLDTRRESGSDAQGSTKVGIAYVAADKYLREGVRLESIFTPKELLERVNDGLARVNAMLPKANQRSKAELEAAAKIWLKAAESLKDYATDTVELLNDRLKAGQKVLAEGAQAYWLDVNHGMYPAVTSSSTTVAGLLDGLGVSAKHLGKVTGVTKAVKSHVGGGPLVTEVTDQELATAVRGPLGKSDSEYGVTTKRPRRIGFPDIVELRNAIRVNGVDELAISKLDHVARYGKEVPVAISYTLRGKERLTAPSSALALSTVKPNYKNMKTWQKELSEVRRYEDLPASAQAFIELFETELGVPVTKIGVGPERSQVIFR
jgi:adenylosuccinate synthase